MTYPKEPNPGDKISAQLIRDIIRCLRRITPLAGPGVKASVTPNGTHLTASATKGVAPASSSPSCWSIGMDEEDMQKMFVNRFFQIGGVIFELKDDDEYASTAYVDQYVGNGTVPEGEEYSEEDLPYVALRVNMSTDIGTDAVMVVGYQELEDMVEESKDPLYYVKPLYKLTHNGGVAIDFRNMPQLASMEMPEDDDSGGDE